MQNFVNEERYEPRKRSTGDRVKDFKEIYEIFSKEDASSQADRCIQCGDPFCHSKCPLHNYIPFWLKATSGMKRELAFNLSNETNPYPEITGRICPQDRLCEGDCTLNDGHGAITIGAIETFISEEGFKKGLKPAFPGITTKKKVAVIGAGPAGLACATYLLRAGIAVSMYDKQNKAGGLLTYGIPGFKLDKDVVARRVRWLQEAGMDLHVNTHVGKDVSFDEIAHSHDALFLSIGAESPRKANVANENAQGVFMAIDFLRSIQKKLFNESYDKKFEVKNKNVVVIGGGDTAMDCLRTSIREGAKSVTCLYRRDKYNMPGSKKEFKNAIEEGAEFVYNVTPKEILVNSEGQVIGIDMHKTILGAKDASCRQCVEIVKGGDFRVDADVIIFALGFTPTVPTFLAENGIEVNKSGCIVVNHEYQTTKLGVYAGGDCKRGSDLVVTAAKRAKKPLLASLKNYLDNEPNVSFIEAALRANKELSELLHVKGLDASHHQSFDVGAGGDVSAGIDLEAEQIFIKHLLPFGELVSEESGVIENPSSSVRIVLDPIDGSDNLLSHLPYYGTSIAYFEHEICTKAMITNLANGDVFIKDENGLRQGKIGQNEFFLVRHNAFSKVGIFERSYCSKVAHAKLQSAHIKYRSPGAFALSLAYAHDVSFVLYEGAMRSYDVEAGLFICADLHRFYEGDIFLVSKDKEIFDKIKSLFISN